MADEKKPHFFLKENTKEVYNYIPVSQGGGEKTFPNKTKHAERLKKLYSDVLYSIEQQRAINIAVKERGGSYVEFFADKDLFIASKFEDNTHGLRLLNVQNVDEEKLKATVYIPEKKDSYYSKKIEEYASSGDDDKNPKNQKKLAAINDIQLSKIEDIWCDDLNKIPIKQKSWCEIWLDSSFKNYDSNSFFEYCKKLNISFSDSFLEFPDRTVYLAFVDKNDLQRLIDNMGYIAEIHEFHEPSDFFAELPPLEQKEWADDLLKRSLKDEDVRSRICILDTGVAFNHPLLSGVAEEKDFQAIDPTWNIKDFNGHGTEMAGICEYFNLQEKIASSEKYTRKVQIESVKILHETKQNKKNLYGKITEQAVSLAEISAPSDKRVHCMAITDMDYEFSKGVPTSWSAKLDEITAGYEDGKKKLFIVSAGNCEKEKLEELGYPKATYKTSVQSPAQAWNVLTVGAASLNAYTVHKDLKPLAQTGDVCPYSSTSLDWESSWPIKPDVLFDGGNAVRDDFGGIYTDNCLLTLNNEPTQKLFSFINATSAATAQASNVAAELLVAYPDLWAETVRALIVHSARWPKRIWDSFENNKTKILRTYGYGIANKGRTLNSFKNNAVMIVEDTIQPFVKKDQGIVYNAMNIHKFPWPKDFLEQLETCEVRLKITLSYFIDSCPGSKGWKDKFLYQSAGLRFDLKKSTETDETFKKRINKAFRDEEYTNNSREDHWIIGPQRRNVGSIHSDYWRGRAIDLAECNSIAIIPVAGWWKFKRKEAKFNETLRYSLIVSLETDNPDIDIYNAVKTAIESKIETSIAI